MNKWEFYFKPIWWHFVIKYEVGNYEDNRHQLILSPGWGFLCITFPWRGQHSGCDNPEYGIYFYSEGRKLFDSIWLCLGEKKKSYDMPWAWEWVRTSKLCKDVKHHKYKESWVHEYKGNPMEFYADYWKDVLWTEKYPYEYKLNSGKIQERTATVQVSEREWRWKGFKKLGFPKRVRKCIDIKFDKEVGERTGSWKGGVTGCGYDMKKGETPLQTFQRMSVERKFT